MNEHAFAIYLQENIPPGHELAFDRETFHDLTRDIVPEYGWNVADWILETIVGSSYEWSYREVNGSETPTIIFSRRLAPLTDGRRTYVSPDRRQHYRESGPDMWIPLPQSVADK